MAEKTIGIIYHGNRGEILAYKFSHIKVKVKLFEVEPERAKDYISGAKEEIQIIDGKGRNKKVLINRDYISWASDISELSDCSFVVDFMDDTYKDKKKHLLAADKALDPELPLLSNSVLYVPSMLSDELVNKNRFAVAYFNDIEYGPLMNIELIYNEHISEEKIASIITLLEQYGLKAYKAKECIGFVHNRIGCLGMLKLFDFYDKGIIDYNNLVKYFILTRSIPYSMELSIAEEIQTGFQGRLELFRMLRKEYGQRFYLPEFMNDFKDGDDLKECIKKYSKEYDPIPGEEPKPEDTYNTIYITGIDIIHSSFLFALLNHKKNIILAPDCKTFTAKLEKDSERLYQRCINETRMLEENEDIPREVELIIDFTIESFEDKTARVNSLQAASGKNIPVLLNTPIFKIEDIAKKAANPAMVFGMYTQKNYLLNTELVMTGTMDKAAYLAIRSFIKKMMGDYLETKDADVRPLITMILSKMLESLRVLEEGLASEETIENLGVERYLFRDMKKFGMDKIKFLCEHLKPIYGEIFDIPGNI